jgi:hypothetical protein
MDVSNSFTAQYSLRDNEYSQLIKIISASSSPYNAFFIAFLKEVDGDLNKVLRILNVGVKSKKKIFNYSLIGYLVSCIKEAIVLSNYEKYIEEDGFISIVQVAKDLRFELANINRQTIIRTFRKYNIQYNYKR